MTTLKTLVSQFEVLSRIVLDAPGGGGASTLVPSTLGLSEAQQSFEEPTVVSEQTLAIQIKRLEEQCLSFPVASPSDRELKLDFLLSRMRALTDDVDEFDDYASRLKSLLSADSAS